MKSVVTLIRFTWRYFSGCTALGVLLFCVAPLTLGLATQAFFDRVAGSADGAVWVAVVFVGTVLVGEIVTELALNQTWSGFCYETHTLLQRNALAGILRGFGRFGLPVPPGDAISRFRDEPPSITLGSMDGVADLIGRGLFALVGGFVMWRIDPVLTLAAFAPVIVSSAVSDALGTRSAVNAAAAREATGRLTAFLGDLVGANLALRVAGAAPHAVRHLEEIGDARRRLSLRDRVFAETVNSMNFHLVHVGTGAVLLLGAGKIRSGSFSVGDFALFVVFLDQLTYLPAEIGRVLTELKRTRVSIDRLHALMPGDPRDAVVASAPIHVRGPLPALPERPDRDRLERLEITGLTCIHPSSGRGVVNVSLTLDRGSFVVVTGRIGSGKSTLLHALLGLLPSEGEVRWNGRLVEDPATFFVPPHSAFTPQVPRLFSETLRANLVLGRPTSEDAVDAALRSSVLEEDVRHLEAGLETVVGRRGVKLSGGQIQRSAAARMFLQDAELLVLDDLSSALDTTTEAELWRRLLSRRGDVTCLVVSHSQIALASADQVVTLLAFSRVPRILEPDCAWTAADVADEASWTEVLTPDELDELDGALRCALAKSDDVLDIERDDFPLPTLSSRVKAIEEELINGRGFVRVRGIDRSAYSQAEMEMLYWGFGTHLGLPWAQNHHGHVLGDVTDQAKAVDDPTARGNELGGVPLPFHCDGSDLVGLMCLTDGIAGGLSAVANSVMIHNRLVEERPDLAAALYEEYPYDFRGEQPKGGKPYYTMPVFTEWDGRLFCRAIPPYILASQRHADAPRMTTVQKEALDALVTMADDPDNHVTMELRPGDMQFINNYHVLHGRTAYTDDRAVGQVRHLKRLWLETKVLTDRPPIFANRSHWSEKRTASRLTTS